MIRAQRSLFYFVGEKSFESLEEAQKADLAALLTDELLDFSTEGARMTDIIPNWLLKNKDAIVDTLTTTPRSRLKSRKLHGAVRKKKGTPAPNPATTPKQ